MAFFNFDGTMILDNSSYLVAELAGKGKEAKGILYDVLSKSPEVVEISETPQELIRNLDEKLYRPTLERGATLLVGFPKSRLHEIRFQTSTKLPKMLEIAEKEGGLDIGTLTARDFLYQFIRRHGDELPVRNVDYRIASSNELESTNEVYTGRMLGYHGVEAKMNSFRGGSVFANGLPDFGVCLKASQNKDNGEIYIVENPKTGISIENHNLQKALRKFGISSSVL